MPVPSAPAPVLYSLRRRCRQSGYSLVEMAIVMIIIGLLIGGTLMGTNLMRAAEIRSIIEDEQRIVAAVHAFQDKYGSLPGDIFNATDIWGTLDPDPATCKVTASLSPATCNGDGNGRINEHAPASYEYFRFWQHLANAGMYEGKYAGTGGSHGVYDSDVGVNVPAGKMDGSGYGVYYDGDYSSNSGYFDGSYGHTIYFGRTTYTDYVFEVMLTPEETYNFDLKYDDGKPGTGHIRVNTPAIRPNCADSAVAATAQYMTNVSDKTCNVLFPDAF